jgi:hypothetical protein
MSSDLVAARLYAGSFQPADHVPAGRAVRGFDALGATRAVCWIMSVRLKRGVAKYRRPSSADLDGGPQRRFSDNPRIGKGNVGVRRRRQRGRLDNR